MSVKTAKAYFLGTDGLKKMSCGQAIICAFRERFAIPESAVSLFAAYGGGRAPGGECGAFYAARYILGKDRSAALKECESALVAQAGSTKCREIRALNRLSCAGCVEKVAGHIVTA